MGEGDANYIPRNTDRQGDRDDTVREDAADRIRERHLGPSKWQGSGFAKFNTCVREPSRNGNK